MLTRMLAASALLLALTLAAPGQAQSWGAAGYGGESTAPAGDKAMMAKDMMAKDSMAKDMMAKEAMAPAGAVSVHTAIGLPEFIPGMGRLFVDARNLPVGPYLAYDRAGKHLVATIYMVPLKTFNGHLKLDGLKGSGLPVDHVDMYFNPGHPGVAEPHYHIVLWHVDEAGEAAVK